MSPVEWLNNNLYDLDDNKKKVIEFVFLWQEYNYKYHLQKPKLGDYEGALLLAKSPKAQHEYSLLKDDFISKFSQIPSSNTQNNPRIKLCADYDIEKTVAYNEDNSTLQDFLNVIYQIRCNFLHGRKMREREDIDIKLIGWAYDCLKILLFRINFFDD